MRFGKKAAVHTPRRMRAMLALGAQLDALGTPPPATNNRAAPRRMLGAQWYQLYGNDEYGDCVLVDTANFVTLTSANAGGLLIVPQLDQVLGAYSSITGFQAGPPVVNDEGTDENTAIAYMKTTGIAGQRIDDSAPIDVANLDHMRWAIALFMGLRSGILVSPAYIQAFESRLPWTADMPPGDEGHDVRLLDYDESGVYAGTWGRDDQLIPWDKVTQPGFIDELHAELWYDVIRAAGTAPDGLSLDQLEADLRYIGPEEATYTQNVTTRTDYGAIEAAKLGVTRNPEWHVVEAEVKRQVTLCAGCGATEPGVGLQVHHWWVFHEAALSGRPDVEMTRSNLFVLCETEHVRPAYNCHLVKGHGLDFRTSILTLPDVVKTFYGMDEAACRADPRYQAIVADEPRAYPEWTRDERIAYRRALDVQFPIDGAECRAVVARFPGTAPVPFDDWVATLPAG
jgi:hypothetical protein